MKVNKDNLQPTSENSIKVSEKVQRLTGEELTNKPDTNIPHPSKVLKCSSCKEEKSCSEFYVDRSHKRGYQYRCKTCSRLRVSQYHKDNREVILDKWKSKRDSLTAAERQEIAQKQQDWYRKDIRQRLLDRAKERSKKLELTCDLEIDDIVIPTKCPLLETPFKYGSRHDKWQTYSLDRIDNSKGYVKGNVWVITHMANTMKSQASSKELRIFAKNILKYFKDDEIV